MPGESCALHTHAELIISNRARQRANDRRRRLDGALSTIAASLVLKHKTVDC